MKAIKWGRKLHRWAAILTALPVLVVILSGIILQMKKEWDWVQPPTREGVGKKPALNFETILNITRTVSKAGIEDWQDIDRLDVRPDKGVIKVRAKNRWEIQIDTSNGEVLQTAIRRSDLIESIHDGSFFHNNFKLWVFLPSAIVLAAIWGTGIYLFIFPYLNRRNRKRGQIRVAGLVCVVLMLIALTLPATAEEESKTKSGYEDIPQFGGPSSTGAQLEEDNEIKIPLLRFPAIDQAFKPWFDWKGQLDKDYGISFGFDYTGLGQIVSDSPGEDGAAGGIFRFFGNWTVIGLDSGNTGSIVFKVENRHRLGTNIAPQSLGFEAGYVGLTSAPFSETGWGITNLYWKQKLNQGRFSFVAGVVDPTDYVDVYGLVNPWTAFNNLVFLTDPTIPAPNQGLGAAFGAMVTDNFYVVGGLADTNGDPTMPGDWFKTFFDNHEYFYHLEAGWTSSQDRIYLDNVHLTGWYADERANALVEDGWGLAFSAAKFIDDTWMPFLRAGYSNGGGALLEGSVGAGVGYYFKESKDLVGFGLNWGKPPGQGLDDQYTAELFYRLQLAQNLAITPDVQLIIDPALNPDEDMIWVFGLRARLAL